MTTACDSLHFQPNWRYCGHISKSIFAFPDIPTVFETVILLTAFPALGY
jgi:hypothetical protein